MTALIHQEYPIAAEDYTRAGEASADIKRRLKQLGVSSMVLRRVAVASDEVEMNLAILARGGVLTLEVEPDRVRLVSRDVGPGIPDVELAIEEARSLGFGAGMGLPNLKRNADQFAIESAVGVGTTIEMSFCLQ